MTGAAWGTPIYCSDKLLQSAPINIASLLQPSRTYYILIDGFAVLPDLGRFKAVTKPARKARNPRTGAMVDVPAKTTLNRQIDLDPESALGSARQ